MEASFIRKKEGKMRIIIMTDLEGTAGVVDFETQTYPEGKYFEKAKELLTEEVNAACEGLSEEGVDEILIVDGHGPGGILPEKIHPKAKLLHGRPVPIYWEIDKNWDGLFLLAHHSMNGTENGNLNHTFSSKNIVRMVLNGEEIGEIGMHIYLAGHFGIPALLISGDLAACNEAERYVKNIEKAVVKWGINRTCAISLSPSASRSLIKEKAKIAIRRISEIKPVKIEGECELIIEYISSSLAYSVSKRPDRELITPTKVRIKGKDFLEIWRKFVY